VLEKAVSLSPKELSSVSICWGAPFLHKFSQGLQLSRILVNITSIFYSTKKNALLHLVNAAIQSFTLFKISQLSWIRFQKIFSKPDASFWSKPGDQQSIEHLTVGSYFLIPPGSESSILKSIYDYCTGFFNNSHSWCRYHSSKLTTVIFDTKFKPVMEHSLPVQGLMYNVAVQPSPIQSTQKGIVPYIEGMVAAAYDASQGSWSRVNF
jgi:hypothetical protein